MQPCLDSYRQRQISQSDFEITGNCGKKRSRNLIDLFPKMSVSDWLLQRAKTTRIRNRAKRRKVERLFAKIKLELFSYCQNFKQNHYDFAAKHTHWHLQWCSHGTSHLGRPKDWSLRQRTKLNSKLASLEHKQNNC